MFKRSILSLVLTAGFIHAAQDPVDLSNVGYAFTPEAQRILDEFRATLKAGGESAREAFGDACSKLYHLRHSESLPISESEHAHALKDLLDAASMRWQEERALYWAGVRDFAWDMFSPYAYVQAVKQAWQAGWQDATHVLWTEHKAVLAGSAVITAVATALFVAYKKGCFSEHEEADNE